MLRSVIQKEMLENLLSYKFSIVTIVSVVLIFVCIFIMYKDYCLRVENYQILQPKPNEAIAIIPPTPLSIFVRGLDENLCRAYEFSFLGSQIQVGSKQQSVNKLFRLFTTPDLLYVVKVVLALCAMLFSFDAVCGEKETGTLRQSLSNSLKRPNMIIGKWIGGFTSFILPFFMAILLSAIFVSLSSRVDMNGQRWAKFIFFALTCVVYLAVFFSLGLLISCLTHHSSTSLVFSLFVWAILIFIIPNLGNILAQQLVKIPTVQRLEVRRNQIWIKEIFKTSNKKQSWDEARKRTSEETNKMSSDYRRRFDRLIDVSQNITRISPAAAFTFIASDIMATGISEERRLKNAILEYKDFLLTNKKQFSDQGIALPAFAFRRVAIQDAINPVAGNFMILLLYSFISFASTYVCFLRYDAR